MTDVHDLFSDEVLGVPPTDIESDTENSDPKSWIVPIAIVFGALCVVAIGVAVWSSTAAASSTIVVHGADVGALQPGAPVMLEQVQVGTVDSVSIRQGIPVAALKISREYMKEIPPDSRFEVGSLNWLMPGNIGVKVLPNNAVAHDANTQLGDIAIDHSILPTYIPTQSYLVIALLFLATVIALGIILKIVCSAWVAKTLAAAAIALVVYLFWTGALREEQIQDFLRTQSTPGDLSQSNETASPR